QARLEFQEDLRFECEGLSVFITHIAGYPGRFNARVREILNEQAPKLMICGHSHILKVQFDPKYDILFMNPGAAGIHGFHQVRTMLRFQVSDGKVHHLEVIEFPKKN
ncbi:MAG: metallophosphoesterase family protein, partial [Flavobacterium sp.]